LLTLRVDEGAVLVEVLVEETLPDELEDLVVLIEELEPVTDELAEAETEPVADELAEFETALAEFEAEPAAEEVAETVPDEAELEEQPLQMPKRGLQPVPQ
jgi:hypothetical protein